MNIKNIGIIYCASNVIAPGREEEKKGDLDVIPTALGVKAVLEKQGYKADLVEIDPERIGDLCRYDWIFNLADTVFGCPLAEYQITAAMERLGIAFTGSGAAALEACRNKTLTKKVLIKFGIPTPAYTLVPLGGRIADHPKFPLIVKPNMEDGSYGITKQSVVTNERNLARQVEWIHRLYEEDALVEEFIDGRDVTASIIGNGNLAKVLPLSETTFGPNYGWKLKTFNLNFEPGSADFTNASSECPSQLKPELEELIMDYALRAYQVMDCRDYARIDFRLRDKNPYVLEVNPNPCISPDDAAFIRSCNMAGLSYEAAVLKILEESVQRVQIRMDVGRAVCDYL